MPNVYRRTSVRGGAKGLLFVGKRGDRGDEVVKESKRRALEKAGWKFGGAEIFLGMSLSEVVLCVLKRDRIFYGLAYTVQCFYLQPRNMNLLKWLKSDKKIPTSWHVCANENYEGHLIPVSLEEYKTSEEAAERFIELENTNS